MVQGGMSIVKYLLFAFNLIFVIFGILLIWSGIKSAVVINDYQIVLKDFTNASVITLAIFGFIVFFIAFLGCCGAIKENSCMLTSFSMIIMILLIIEITLGAVVLSQSSKIEKELKKEFNVTIHEYIPNSNRSFDRSLDILQHDLNCCGGFNYTDWDANQHIRDGHYPSSCCKSENATDGYCKVEHVFKDGCITKLEKLLKEQFNFIGIVAILIGTIQLLGVVFSCCLARSIKKEYEVV